MTRRPRRAAVIFAVLAVVLLGAGALIVSRVTCTSLVMWSSDEKVTQLHADTAALDRISRASRAKMYEAKDPTQVRDVMLDVLSNF